MKRRIHCAVSNGCKNRKNGTVQTKPNEPQTTQVITRDAIDQTENPFCQNPENIQIAMQAPKRLKGGKGSHLG